jgi:hypothetical protein
MNYSTNFSGNKAEPTLPAAKPRKRLTFDATSPEASPKSAGKTPETPANG